MDLDGLKAKAQDFLKDHDDQIEKGIDKAEEFAKDKFAGQADRIDQAADKLRGLLPDDDPGPGPADKPAGPTT